MNCEDQKLILAQLVRMEPGLADAEPHVQYEACYAFYQAVDGWPENWVLEEMIDASTLKRQWMWRRKS